MERGAVRHAVLLEAGQYDLVFGATEGRESVERRTIGGIWEADQDGAPVVKKLYDVATKEVGGLLDIARPLGTIKSGVSRGGSARRVADKTRA